MRKMVVGLLLTGITAASLAADGGSESARRCVSIKDSLARLVCYDKAFQNESTEPPAATLRSAPPRASTPSALPVPPTPAVAPPSLGEEHLRKTVKERDREQVSDLTAVVTALKEIRQNTYRITLDNGQVWEQMDLGNGFRIAPGDTVRIERSKMGGYYLARQGPRSYGQVRVTRLK
jgi:hypothetical protein